MKKGFTLIELLVVIAIISLLASVVLVALNSSRAKARVAKAASDLHQISQLLGLYLNSSDVYPCFDHTWDETKEIAWAAPYAKWPKNPWGSLYHWEHQGAYAGQPAIQFSISISNVPFAEAQALDQILDGSINASSGILQYTDVEAPGSGFYRLEYGGMDQSVPFVHCHI